MIDEILKTEQAIEALGIKKRIKSIEDKQIWTPVGARSVNGIEPDDHGDVIIPVGGAETDPVWESEKALYLLIANALTQTAADALYLTEGQADLRYPQLDLSGNFNIMGTITGASLIKSGGTSSQFLKANGSVDSSTYLPATVTSPSTDQILKYNGSAWVNGAETTVNGGSGVDFFYDDNASDIGGYATLNKAPDSAAEQDETAVCNNNKVLIEEYASASGGLGGTQIDAGVWTFDIWAYASLLTLASQVVIDIYKRTSGGTETLLFSINSGTITTTSLATIDLYSITSVQQAFSINATDRLVTKVSGQTSNVTNTTVHFVHGGTTHYSHFNTPLVIRHNDLAGLNAGDYQHLTAANATDLTDGGDTSLHTHSGYVYTAGLCGNGSDGDLVLGADALLARDMQYDSLNLAGYTMDPNGFRIFCRTPIQMNGGSFSRVGKHGLNGGSATGGTPGVNETQNISLNVGSIATCVAIGLMATPPAGKTTASNGANGLAGSAGTNVINAVGSNGVAGVALSGGKGGNCVGYTGGTAAGGGAGGTATLPVPANGLYTDYLGLVRWRTNNSLLGSQTPILVNAGNGSGGSGGGGASPGAGPAGAGGGGGSPGGTGGYIIIIAPAIIGSGTINVSGGTGGTGGNGGNGAANAGGGGGGCGGNGGQGGVICLITHITVTGVTYNVSTGAVGAHGNGGLGNGTGSNGDDGLDGVAGTDGLVLTHIF